MTDVTISDSYLVISTTLYRLHSLLSHTHTHTQFIINDVGLQNYVLAQLDKWHNQGVEGHFTGKIPPGRHRRNTWFIHYYSCFINILCLCEGGNIQNTF